MSGWRPPTDSAGGGTTHRLCWRSSGLALAPEGTLWQSITRRRIVIIRDPYTRQALVELTIPATKKYVAQRQAGGEPLGKAERTHVMGMETPIERQSPNPQ
jgi:hypothetical protein